MGNVLTADLRHFPAEDLSLAEPPSLAMRLRDHRGAIVEAVTSRGRQEIDYVTAIKCRGLAGSAPLESSTEHLS